MPSTWTPKSIVPVPPSLASPSPPPSLALLPNRTTRGLEEVPRKRPREEVDDKLNYSAQRRRRWEDIIPDSPPPSLNLILAPSSNRTRNQLISHLPTPPAESSSAPPARGSDAPWPGPLAHKLSKRQRKRIRRLQREGERSQAIPPWSPHPPTPPLSMTPDEIAAPPGTSVSLSTSLRTSHELVAGSPSAGLVLRPPARSPGDHREVGNIPGKLDTIAAAFLAEVDADIVPLNRPIVTPSQTNLCRIAEVRLKGKGLLSTRFLRAGQTIIREPPFIRFTHPIDPEALRRVYRALSPAKRALFRSFAGTAPRIEERIVRIAETNAIPLSTEESDHAMAHVMEYGGADAADEADEADGVKQEPPKANQVDTPSGMFETICRVNHSCAPNAVWRWNGRKREMTLLALMDIPANEEITACYLSDSLVDRAARRDELEHDFGFTCCCSACARSKDELSRDEAELRRVVQLQTLWRGDTRSWAMNDLGAMRDIEEALRIMVRQRRVDGQGEILEALFRLHAAWGRRSEAIDGAQRALRLYQLTMGKDAAAKTAYARFVNEPEISQAWLACVPPVMSGAKKPGAGHEEDEEEEGQEEVFEFREDEDDEDFEVSEAEASDGSDKDNVDYGNERPKRHRPARRRRWRG